ncbi:hypothetical protein [Spiroplasma endosymbiont of Panorpa germanica]|uniref:hypothetical protein n=1 Tax=Spiroplasma endosymbiont of Panorpa germanica TaxID=3066314 RepID=UPI0030CC75BC
MTFWEKIDFIRYILIAIIFLFFILSLPFAIIFQGIGDGWVTYFSLFLLIFVNVLAVILLAFWEVNLDEKINHRQIFGFKGKESYNVIGKRLITNCKAKNIFLILFAIVLFIFIASNFIATTKFIAYFKIHWLSSLMIDLTNFFILGIYLKLLVKFISKIFAANKKVKDNINKFYEANLIYSNLFNDFEIETSQRFAVNRKMGLNSKTSYFSIQLETEKPGWNDEILNEYKALWTEFWLFFENVENQKGKNFNKITKEYIFIFKNFLEI